MASVLGLLYWPLIVFSVVLLSDRACQGVRALNTWRRPIKVLAVFWCLAALAKWLVLDDILPPADAIIHKSKGWEIADALHAGDVDPLLRACRPGNPAYQALLGLIYALTSAPEPIIYTVNAAIAFLGLVYLLRVLALHTAATTIAPLAVLSCLLAPSAVLWTTTNLKEGLTLYGGCTMLTWTLARAQRSSQVAPALGFSMLAILRPHVAVFWALSIGLAATIRSGRYYLGLCTALGVLVCALGLKTAAPDFFDASIRNGITDSMGDRQSAIEENSEGAHIRAEDRVIFYTGITLIMLRPLPNEVTGFAELLAGAEAWIYAIAGAFYWRRPSALVSAVTKHPLLLTVLFALLAFGFYFSFMYNMGLVVRQRVMVFPAVFLLYFWPAAIGRANAPHNSAIRYAASPPDIRRIYLQREA